MTKGSLFIDRRGDAAARAQDADDRKHSVHEAVIAFALRQRVLMVVLFVMMLGGGVVAFRQLNIEAYPDPTPPMVDVVTQSPGLSAEEIERYITIPIETQIAGLRNLTSIRTISLYGLSDVKLQFSFDFTYEEALQQVLNRLSQLPPLPNNAQPQISPVSPIGEIYRYRLVGPPGYSVLDLKTLQDWVLQRRFRAVPGVIDVTGWGGKTKTFELQVDFNKLIAYGLTLPQMLQALNNSNINVGGNTVNIGPQSAVVRGVGLIRSIDDIRDTMLTQSGGNPVLVRDVATVIVGYKPRLGIAGQDDDDDIVAGHRADAPRRAEHADHRRGSSAEVERINGSEHPAAGRAHRAHLRPQGPDRHHDQHGPAQHDVRHRADLHPAMAVPRQSAQRADRRRRRFRSRCSLRSASWCCAANSANLLSVGAIDFGLIVDATVIMVESIFRRLSEITRTAPRAAGPIGRQRLDRQAARDLPGRRRRQPLDLLRRRHHHRGLLAAVHAERRRGPHLRPDGQDLRLCARRRPDRDLHGHAGAQRDPAARAGRGDRDLGGALAARLYMPVLRFAVANKGRDACRRAGAVCWSPASRCARWAWSSCPSSRKAICGSAPRCRRPSRSRRATATSTACAS